jgi:lactate dehydrogenase-like 2-hydroxyacid dehydrogenase
MQSCKLPLCLCTYFDLGGRWPTDFIPVLKAHGIDVRLNSHDRWYTEDELVNELKEVDAILAGGDNYSGRVIQSTGRLKIIARVGVGYDRVDLDSATRRGVYVTWTPIPELAKAVADEAFTLILSVLRRAPYMDRHVRDGGYDIEELGKNVRDVYPLTLGIIGLGRIGVEVARRARRGFEMKVLYHDVVRRQDLETEWGINFVSMEKLLSDSDVITIHTPLTAQTKELIGEREIAMMKKTAVLINTSRGCVINERALYNALVEGRLGGAGLSVLSEEPPSPSHPFYKLEDKLSNVVLFPHMGLGTHTGRAMMMTAAEDVIAVLDGRQPKYVVNKEILKSRS